MTTQEKLTKIESVIREVCTELQELTFGCEVSTWKQYRLPEKLKVVCRNSAGNIICDTGLGMTLTIKDKNILEIIGHPIHFHHILRAIRSTMTFVTIDVLGRIFQMGKMIAEFDLTKPYHLQSDEFISWLYGVLCK